MSLSPVRPALAGLAASLLLAGCAGGVSSLAPGTPTESTASHASVASGYRLLQGPAVSGPILVPIAHPNRTGYILPGKKKKPTLYVADISNNVVNLYDPTVKNPTPIGMITSGLDFPAGLATDKAGTLYVANDGNATVTEYAAGTTTPSFTINSGMSSPYGIAVDSHGNVFVANLGNNTLTGYHPGSASPFETVTGLGPNTVGVGVDGKDNIYVADDSDNTVYKVAAGSSTAVNSGYTNLVGPIGIAFTAKNTAFISNFSANTVGKYANGSLAPTGSIATGISGPTLGGFTPAKTYFQSNQDLNVVGYLKGANSPFSTITGLSDPLGIASFPIGKR